MFKTIEECRLDLVAHTQGVPYTFLMVDDNPSGRLAQRDMDFMPASAARVSFGNEDKTGQDIEKDRKLMKYLADHKHMTPFEYQHATFLIECPLFIRSQIHRHRTFSYNEISRRYTDENLEFWLPTSFRGQSKSNRQASSDDVITELKPVPTRDDPYGTVPLDPTKWYRSSCHVGLNTYQTMVDSGVAREIARAVLPQSLLTKFYMGGTLRNWQHFIELRRDEHAQYEVQVIAGRIAGQLKNLWPESCRALGI